MSANGEAATPSGPALVTGATGFLGQSLVRRLIDRGVPVRALVRTRAKAKSLSDAGVDVVIGDINDRAAVATAVKGVTVVFHLAGKLFEPWESPDEYRNTHVRGTKLLIEQCRQQPELERFVHCSTTGVLGSTGREPADENAPMRPGNVYEATKAEAESAVRDACNDGWPAVIARPGLVYGPGDLHLLGFFRAVLRRRFRPIGRDPVLLHPVYIEDMTEAFLRCATSPNAVGECFHFAGPEGVSLEGLASAIAEAVGTTMPRGRIPRPAARGLAAVGDLLPAKLRHSAPLTRSRLDFLTHSRVYSVAKADALLDFQALTDLPTGIKQTVMWYRQLGHLPT